MVLAKRDSPSKVDTLYHPEPFTIKEVNGPMISIESGRGRVFRRNVSVLRPYLLSDDFNVTGALEGCVGKRNTGDWVPAAHGQPKTTIHSHYNAEERRDVADDVGDREVTVGDMDDSIVNAPARPRRERKAPDYLKDYILS